MDLRRQDQGIAAGVLVLVTALMGWDHLLGNEGGSDEFPVDPPTFVIAMVAALVAAAVVFGLVVRRAGQSTDRTRSAALWLTGIAVVTAPFLSWLGVPQVVAGGGLATGLRLRAGGHTRAGNVVAGLCCLVLVFGVLATAFPATD